VFQVKTDAQGILFIKQAAKFHTAHDVILQVVGEKSQVKK